MPALSPSRAAPAAPVTVRPSAPGKFLSLGDERLFVRGVTYGPFRPDATGSEYHDAASVRRDFAAMRRAGINSVRLYTVPPRWLLDLAAEHGLRVMVGLPWEQHITFLDDAARVRDITERVRAGVRRCRGHPALLCYAVGNEIPASITRWYGRRRLEQHLRRLYDAAKEEDPGGLVTYVNYPTTEYLELPFLDLLCFNVYLETQERLEAYLARLQNLAGDRPLLMTELGIDSRRNGLRRQAEALDWQVRTAFAAGCAGTFVFSWTDEWHRGGEDIEDWDFGLTTRERRPKPALESVRRAFADAPLVPSPDWPRVSVVVCTFNGARTLRECLQATRRLEYPDYEVIVVDDGSTDSSAAIAAGFDHVRLIRTENRGLSSARNTGLEAATGEIVAYLDDDAFPDPLWLGYLATTFARTQHVGVGGPNVPPPGDGFLADCVANAPGGPIHVLLSDQEAEHIPGCNMAFRRESLRAIGGFDPQFRVAGDDVDLCWRLQQRGWTLGFHPGAMVWHHRRATIAGYWRQQKGYGKAEAMLERKWPEKYNGAGHVAWRGRLYGRGLATLLGSRRGRVYQGTWGSALFQSIYHPAPGILGSLAQMPEFFLLLAFLAVLAALGLQWEPLRTAALLGAAAGGAVLLQAGLAAAHAVRHGARRTRWEGTRAWAVTTFLHLLQPIARLTGRLRHGLTPWRLRGLDALSLSPPRVSVVWSERWRSPTEWLESLEAALRARGLGVTRGGEFDEWDLEVSSGMLGASRVQMVIEEHGGGRQLVRFRARPRSALVRFLPVLLLGALAGGAALDRAWLASAVLGAAALALFLRKMVGRAVALSAVARAAQGMDRDCRGEARSAAPSEKAYFTLRLVGRGGERGRVRLARHLVRGAAGAEGLLAGLGHAPTLVPGDVPAPPSEPVAP